MQNFLLVPEVLTDGYRPGDPQMTSRLERVRRRGHLEVNRGLPLPQTAAARDRELGSVSPPHPELFLDSSGSYIQGIAHSRCLSSVISGCSLRGPLHARQYARVWEHLSEQDRRGRCLRGADCHAEKTDKQIIWIIPDCTWMATYARVIQVSFEEVKFGLGSSQSSG